MEALAKLYGRLAEQSYGRGCLRLIAFDAPAELASLRAMSRASVAVLIAFLAGLSTGMAN